MEKYPTATRPVAFERHDHYRCRKNIFRSVERLCTQRQVRLTPVRRRTLELLLESHSAVGAYDLLAELEKDGYGQKPPIVYRALHFLLEQGFVHKLEQHSAFIACVNPDTDHEPCFLICQSCKRVAEQSVPKANQHLASAAHSLGFRPSATQIEVTGTCSRCPQLP